MSKTAEPSAATLDTAKEQALPHYAQFNRFDRYGGYRAISIVNHWLTVLVVPLMAITAYVGAFTLHVSLGLLIAVPLLLRVGWRFASGFARVPPQHIALNFVFRLTIIALLVSMGLLALTGILMPFAQGSPYVLFGFVLLSSLADGYPMVTSVFQTIHALSAKVLYVSIAIHLLAALKHWFDAGRMLLRRIVIPVANGK